MALNTDKFLSNFLLNFYFFDSFTKKTWSNIEYKFISVTYFIYTSLKWQFLLAFLCCFEHDYRA